MGYSFPGCIWTASVSKVAVSFVWMSFHLLPKATYKKKARSWRWCCCKQTGARVSGTLVPSPFIREHQRIRGETHAGGNRLTRRQGQCNRSILLNKSNRASATHRQEIRRRKERTLTRITHIKEILRTLTFRSFNYRTVSKRP